MEIHAPKSAKAGRWLLTLNPGYFYTSGFDLRHFTTSLTMNSERRHELQQNDLAVYLNKINKSIEPYSKFIAVGVGVLVVSGLAWAFYSSEQSAQRSEATLNLIKATSTADPEVLRDVSDSFPETISGKWARVYQGQLYLAQGIQQLYEDSEQARILLEDAKQTLASAVSGSDEILIRSRGQFGIARASEALGEVDEAIEAYKKVISVGESEAMIKKSQERIDMLEKPETLAFMTWFAEQDFSPADPSLPPSLPNLNDLPDAPGSMPTLPGLNLDLDSGDSPRDLEGGIELPGEGATTTPQDASAKPSELVLPPTDGETTPGSENATPADSTPTADPASEPQPTAEGDSAPVESSESQPATDQEAAADDGTSEQ